MNYYRLEPEVAGALGSKTSMDVSIHPPKVESLQYEFYGWLGDVILQSFPCYIITTSAAKVIFDARLNGFRLAHVEISKSYEFLELFPDTVLPEFKWLKVFGRPGIDDFGLTEKAHLIISQRALDLLSTLGVKHAHIYSFSV